MPKDVGYAHPKNARESAINRRIKHQTGKLPPAVARRMKPKA